MNKILASLAAASVITLGALGGVNADDRYGKQKVVYHVNYDGEKAYNATLGNIRNHIQAVGKDNIELVVVMNGDGVNLLKMAKENADFESKIVNLKAEGVGFQVCNNTLVGRKIDYKKDLYDVEESDIVPAGVAEVARLQHKGYAMIKVD
ncbi:MAG: DsrE family protein [Thiotrichales bacterium]